MPLHIYNSLTRKKELFEPLTKGQVKMYVCGPTVYDEPHIGHLRSAFIFQVVRGYLEFLGYQVKFVRNVTDVDDKIIDKASQSGAADLVSETRKVSEEYHKAYLNDLSQMGIEPPTAEPKATEHISQMHLLIAKLLDDGFAYVAGGDVYFDVNTFKEYGKLSGQDKEAILHHVRIEKNDKKRNPLDFALWKAVKEGEPSWPSPWGPGRPGWHIECSAMSMKYLGETFDIHGGGRDLIFPHHENEIAQSECATGAPFAKIWMHHGLVTIEGHKMSKSLKNYITLGNLPARQGGRQVEGTQELKLLFLGTHYSAALDYSEAQMKMEKAVRERFFFFFEELGQLEGVEEVDDGEIQNFERKFCEAMDDDFNTPQALTVLHEMVDWARKAKNPGVLLAAGERLKRLGKILGLFPREELSYKEPEWISEKMRQRAAARQAKDFKSADAVRRELAAQGVSLNDWPGGKTTWRRI
jgi:cysteinyl-tRNA synthetase